MIEQLVEISTNIGKKASQGFYHTRSTKCAKIDPIEAMHHFKTAVSLKYDNPAMAVRIIEVFQSSTFQPQAFCFAHHSFYNDELFLHGSYIIGSLSPEFNGSYHQAALFTRLHGQSPIPKRNILDATFPYLLFPGYAVKSVYPGFDSVDGLFNLEISPSHMKYGIISDKASLVRVFIERMSGCL